jgi:hypothetical protein
MRSPVQAAPVQRAVARAHQMSATEQQGCNWLSCAGKVVACGAACLSGIGTAECIACLGSAYDDCKGCF